MPRLGISSTSPACATGPPLADRASLRGSRCGCEAGAVVRHGARRDCKTGGVNTGRLWLGFVVAIAINALALWIANGIFGGVDIEGFWAYFFGALVLGIANAVLKPILAIL